MVRKTFHYDPVVGEMVEGPGPRRTDGSGDSWRFSDRLYSDNPFKGHDGKIINSRKSHKEYMKRHGLTTMDDFKGHWDKKAKEREAFYTGKHDREARREAVIRAMEKHRGN